MLPCPGPTQSSLQSMQYYAQQRQGEGGGYSYPAAAAAAAARMQWNPNVHPGQWNPYDFYQQTGGYHLAPSQPAVSSPDHSAATPHNIRDILGGQQQQQGGETLVSEVAKTPSYQKSPTSAAAVGTVFHYPSPHNQQPEIRSPTTPTHQHDFTGGPHGFYLPTALPGRPFGKFLARSSSIPAGNTCNSSFNIA